MAAVRTRKGRVWSVALGVLVLAIVLIAVLWDWNWFRPLVEAQASAQLGRRVTIDHFDLQPGRQTVAIADGVRVENPPGFDDPAPLATIDRLSVTVDVMQYLRTRAIVVPLIRVEHPQVDAREDAAGHNNFTFPALSGPADPNATPPAIGDLQIVDGHAHVVVPQQRSDFVMDIATSEATDSKPAQILVDAKGTYAGQPITGKLAGGALLSLRDAATPYPVDVHLANGPTRVSLTGTIADPMALAGANLKLELSGTDMSLLYPLIGVAIPKTPSYRIAGNLDYADKKINFRHFTGQVGSSDLEGDIAVDPGPARPVMTATLASRQVDLADLGGFIGSQPGRKTTPNETPQQRQEVAKAEASPKLLPTEPINMPKLRAADVHLTYHGAKILGRSVPFDRIAAKLDIDDGRIRLTPLSLGIGGGQIVGNFDLTPVSDNNIRTVADISVQRIDIGRMMAATHIVQGSGTLGGKGNLTSTGNSVASILGNGDGALQVFLASKGDVSSLIVDLSGFQLGNAILSALGIPNRQPIDCVIGDFTMKHGIVNTNTFIVDTKSDVITGGGTMNLRDETLDMRIKTDSKHLTIGTLPAPIGITGPFKDPSIRPNVAVLGARAGVAAALGVLFPPAALLPTIQFGVGDDNACTGLVRRGAAK